MIHSHEHGSHRNNTYDHTHFLDLIFEIVAAIRQALQDRSQFRHSNHRQALQDRSAHLHLGCLQLVHCHENARLEVVAPLGGPTFYSVRSLSCR